MAPLVRMAFSKASLVRMSEGFRSSLTICTMRRPVSCAITRRRESTAGIAALPESAMPSASAIEAMVEAVPMVLQEPAERDIEASASRNSSWVMSPAFTASENCHRCGARAHALAPEVAVQHRPAGDHDRRHVAGGRAHQQRGRGLVAAHQQHARRRSAGRGSPPRPPWRRGCGTSSRSGGRCFRRPRTPAPRPGSRPPRRCRASPARPGSRRWALQGVSSDQVLQDADDRAAVEQVVREALVLHPAAVIDGVAATCRRTIPASAACAARVRV